MPVSRTSELMMKFQLVSFRHFFNKEGSFNHLTAAAYHKPTHILVTGFASGVFHLHELPDVSLVHSLRSDAARCSGCGDVLVSGSLTLCDVLQSFRPENLLGGHQHFWRLDRLRLFRWKLDRRHVCFWPRGAVCL